MILVSTILAITNSHNPWNIMYNILEILLSSLLYQISFVPFFITTKCAILVLK